MQKLTNVLRKLYNRQNQVYDKKLPVVTYSDKNLSKNDIEILNSYSWETNKIVNFKDHSDILSKLSSLKDNDKLSTKRCQSAFVAGVGGSFPRGISVLSSWYQLNNFNKHSYIEKTGLACCWVCGATNGYVTINDSYFQYTLYLGNSDVTNPMYAYLDLNYFVNTPTVEPTIGDKKVFYKLLCLLKDASDNETPGEFEKRLQKMKLIKGNKYTRRAILSTLGIVGVIPNQFIELSYNKWINYGDMACAGSQLKNIQGRSDMEMPWAGWIGRLKLNEAKADELFGDNY